MNGRDEELAEGLRAALSPGEAQPPSERVAALRAAVERAKAERTELPSPVPGGRVAAHTGLRSERRRRFLVGGASAAAGAVVGAVVVSATDDDGPDAPPTEPIEFTDVAAGVTVADAYLIDHTWGVELNLVASGFERGQAFSVLYRTVDDELVAAGSMVGIGEGALTCRLNGAVRRDAVSAIEVYDPSLAVVLRAELA